MFIQMARRPDLVYTNDIDTLEPNSKALEKADSLYAGHNDNYANIATYLYQLGDLHHHIDRGTGETINQEHPNGNKAHNHKGQGRHGGDLVFEGPRS